MANKENKKPEMIQKQQASLQYQDTTNNKDTNESIVDDKVGSFDLSVKYDKSKKSIYIFLKDKEASIINDTIKYIVTDDNYLLSKTILIDDSIETNYILHSPYLLISMPFFNINDYEILAFKINTGTKSIEYCNSIKFIQRAKYNSTTNDIAYQYKVSDNDFNLITKTAKHKIIRLCE